MVAAGSGYADGYQYFLTPTGHNDVIQWMLAMVASRHESVNGRFKNWDILSQKFCHDRNLHKAVFCAIINLTQIEFENGNPPFQVPFSF